MTTPISQRSAVMQNWLQANCPGFIGTFFLCHSSWNLYFRCPSNYLDFYSLSTDRKVDLTFTSLVSISRSVPRTVHFPSSDCESHNFINRAINFVFWQQTVNDVFSVTNKYTAMLVDQRQDSFFCNVLLCVNFVCVQFFLCMRIELFFYLFKSKTLELSSSELSNCSIC